MTSYYMSFAGRKKLVFSHLFLLLYPSSSTKEFLVLTPRVLCRVRHSGKSRQKEKTDKRGNTDEHLLVVLKDYIF